MRCATRARWWPYSRVYDPQSPTARWRGLALLALLCGVLSMLLPGSAWRAWADSQAPDGAPKTLGERLSFFRWLEDYSDIPEEQLEGSGLARLKRIPLTTDQLYPYLSLGGNYRFRYEHSSNQVFGLFGPEASDVGLHRFLLHGDLQLQPAVRFFVQLGGYVESGRPGGPRSTDESNPDFQQAFVDLKIAPVQLRLGRQEIMVGSGLLTDIREGPNQRLSFDAARATVFLGPKGGAAVDVFFGQEVIPEQDAFRDNPSKGARLWGVYGARLMPLGQRASLDLFYLGLDRRDSVYEQGTGDELRHTLGVWLNGAYGAWAYESGGLFQFGSFAGQDIRAWSFLMAHYYTFATLPWQPRLGLRANVGSGDGNPKDRLLSTFDPLFPNPSYLTEAALYHPRNLYELHPVLNLAPYKTVKVSLGFNWLWRFSRDDAVYTLPGVPLVPSQVSRAKYTGSLFDLIVQWVPTPYLLLQLSYVHASAGDALRDAGGSATDFLMTSIETRF